jgi:hypothetical protein
MNEHEIIQASKASGAMTYGGSTGAIYSGLTANEWGVLTGVFCALIGLVMKWYFGYEKLKLQRQFYAKMQRPDQEPDTGGGEL